LTATQGIGQCPKCYQTTLFSEPQPVFAQGKAPKNAAYPSATAFYAHIYSEMCSKGVS